MREIFLPGYLVLLQHDYIEWKISKTLSYAKTMRGSTYGDTYSMKRKRKLTPPLLPSLAGELTRVSIFNPTVPWKIANCTKSYHKQ